MKKVLEIFYFGYGILFCAAMMNWLGHTLGLTSWYDLLATMGFSALSALEWLWLFVVYPFSLGLSIVMLRKFRAQVVP